jgi:hypothetical protein
MDGDPRRVNSKAINHIAVLRTVVSGETAFDKR